MVAKEIPTPRPLLRTSIPAADGRPAADVVAAIARRRIESGVPGNLSGAAGATSFTMAARFGRVGGSDLAASITSNAVVVRSQGGGAV